MWPRSDSLGPLPPSAAVKRHCGAECQRRIIYTAAAPTDTQNQVKDARTHK